MSRLLPLFASQRQPFTLTATTTGASETVTITRLTVDRVTVLDWGDGQWQELPVNSTAAINHMYVTPGAYNMRLANARAITQLQLDSAKLGGLDTAQLRHSAITYFRASAITNSTINSAHMVGWRPTQWTLLSMPTGSYSVNSADMVDWRPTHFWLYTMPAGDYTIDSTHMIDWRPTNWRVFVIPTGNYAIDSSHMVSWRPEYWYLRTMPAGSYAVSTAHMVDWRPIGWEFGVMPAGSYAVNTAHMVDWRPATWYAYSMPIASTTWALAADNFAGWINCNGFGAYNNSFDTTQVNALLWGMYQAATARTVTGGTINVGGTNAAPSGTFQAASSCPVTAATPGKEVAHELLNNGCGGINLGRVWATVTFTA